MSTTITASPVLNNSTAETLGQGVSVTATPTCDKCHCETEFVRRIRTTSGYRNVCNLCFGKYVRCEKCGKYHLLSNTTEINGRNFCKKCIRTYFARCTECGQYENMYAIREVGERHLCTRCFSAEYAFCAHCRAIIRQDEAVTVDGRYVCAGCVDHYKSALAVLVNSYSYTPQNLVFHCDNAEEAASDTLYMGIELEIELPRDMSRNTVAEQIADKTLENYYMKSDGSLNNGIEIVSHPRTFASWNSYIGEFKSKVLRPAIENNCSGHCNSTGGMHVHTSLDAWTPRQMANAFILAFECTGYSQEILALTQRRELEIRRWARLAELGAEPLTKKQKADVLKKINPFGKDHSCRYYGLNVTEHTLEFRVFKSTLRADRFIKNIELVKAIYDYCLLDTRISWAGLFVYIKKHSKLFPNLYKFCKEVEIIKTKGAK